MVCCSWIALISIGTNTEYFTDFVVVPKSTTFLSIISVSGDSDTNEGNIDSNSCAITPICFKLSFLKL